MVISLCDVRDGPFVDNYRCSLQARILDSAPQFARRIET